MCSFTDCSWTLIFCAQKECTPRTCARHPFLVLHFASGNVRPWSAMRARAYGVVMSLTHAEIDQLYSETSVQTYLPEAVLIELRDGSQSPALCFNLVETPRPEERNPEYAAKLRSLAQLLGLLQEYINTIQ